MKRLALLLALLASAPVHAEEFFGDLKCLTLDEECVPVSTLRGEYVKSVASDGTVTQQEADGTESTVTVATGGGASLSDSNPTALTPELSVDPGSGGTASRFDHAHPTSAAAPLGLTTSHAEGTATTFARSDHRHGALATSQPDELTPGQSGAVGSSSFAARANHHHSTPVGTPVAVGSANNEGSAASFARSDHIHDGSGIGGGGGASLSSGTPDALTPDQSGAAGVSTLASRGDHQHAISTAVPLGIAENASEGTSTNFSRSDHRHASLANDFPESVSAGAVSAIGTNPRAARQDHRHHILINVPVALSAGAANAAGASTSVARANHVHGVPVAVPVAVGTANAAGTSTNFSRADHVHEGDGAGGGGGGASLSDSDPDLITPDQAAGGGSSALASRSDHVHGIVTANVERVGTANAEGAAASFSRSDHVHQGLGTTAQVATVIRPDNDGTAGTANTASRRDHQHAFVTDTPVAVGVTNAEGTATNSARADHVHQGAYSWIVQIDTEIVPELADSVISTPRIVLRVGGTPDYLEFLGWTDDDLGTIDHLPIGGHVGLRQSATNIRILAVEDVWDSTNDRYEVSNVNAGVLTESANGTDTELLLTAQSPQSVSINFSSAVPVASTPDLAGSGGTGTLASRSTHAHGIAADTPVATGNANAEGTSTAFSRADHVHLSTGGSGGSTTFTGLTDTPGSITADECVIGNSAGDALEFGSCGTGGGGGEQTAFKSELNNLTISASQSTFTHVLDIDDADVSINQGSSFTISTDANDRERVCVGTAGLYTATGHLAISFPSGGTMRAHIESRFTITPSGGTEAAQDERGRQYNRGRDTSDVSGDTRLSAGHLSVIYDLAAGDCIGLQARTGELEIDYTIDGSASFVELIKHEGGGGGSATLSDADPDTLSPDQAAAAGSDTEASRSDHAHAIGAGTPVAVGTSNAEGSGTLFARNDHRHQGDGIRTLATFTPTLVQVGATTAVGTSALVARQDHRHGSLAGTPVAVGAANAAGGGTDLIASRHVHAGVGSLACSQGLQCNQTVGAVTIMGRLSSAAPEEVGETESAGGTDETVSRSRHVHAGVTSIAVTGTGLAIDQAQGAVTITGSGGGGGMGTASVVAFECELSDVANDTYNVTPKQFLNCATVRINEGGFTVEDGSQTDTTDRIVIPEDGIYEFVASAFAQDGSSGGSRTILHASFSVERGGVVTIQENEGSGYLRRSTGANQISWHHTSLASLEEDDRVGLVLLSNADTVLSIDGSKSFFALAKLGGAVGAAGAAGADGTDGTIVTANPSGTDGSDLTRIAIAGTNWNIAGSGGGASLGSEIPVSLVPDLTSAAGSGTTASRHDHVHGIAGAAPSGSGLGTSNVEGSATAFSRADHSHAGLSSTNPVAILPDASAAVGSNLTAARGNHRHAIIASAPVAIGTLLSEGTGSAFARNNHVHNIPDGVVHGGALVANTIPTSKYGDGTVTAAKMDSGSAADGNVATADGSGGVAWEAAAGGAGVSLSDSVAGTISPGQNSAAGTGATASRFDHAHGIGVGTPVDVGDANAVGSAGSFSRSDHQHQVPIDNTLQFDSSDDLGVNTERVVQEVSEWVQHFASGSGHDTSGHSGKYHEYTSPNTVRRIGSVQYDFDPLNDSGGGGTGKTYQVFVLELTGSNVDVVLGSSAVYSGNSQQHRFHFTDGVLVNPNVRIGIGLHRTDGGNNEGLSVRAGAESQDSPRESYDDASEDFNFVGRFNHDRPTPSVNDTVGGTAANQIYGNPEIFYQIIHTHASLVGDGTVSADHISSGSATDGQVLTADGSAGSAWEDPASGVSLSSTTPDALQVGQSGAVGSGTTAARSNHSHAILGGGPPQDIDTEDNASAGTATTFARGDHVHALAEDFVTPDMLKADSEAEQGLMRTRIDAQEDLTLVTQAAAEAGTETTERAWTAQRVGQAIAALAGGGFDIHDDVGTREVNIGSSDRFIFSDEDATGDPMRYAQFVDIRNRFFDLGGLDTAPADDDLILICDSGTTGCPQERMTVSNLRIYMRSGVPSLSDSIPVNMVPDQTSAPGSGTTASRHDHVHGIASSTPVAIGTSNQEGNFTSFARTNHVHAGLTNTGPEGLAPDKANAVGTGNRAARQDHVHSTPAAAPVSIGTSNSEAGPRASRGRTTCTPASRTRSR